MRFAPLLFVISVINDPPTVINLEFGASNICMPHFSWSLWVETNRLLEFSETLEFDIGTMIFCFGWF